MKIINLVVFTEQYWDKGLIYSQNILPLVELSKKENVKIQLLSFTSFPLLIWERKKINQVIKEFKEMGVNVINFPVLFYPTKKMILKWWLLPFYYLNVFFYIFYLNIKDSNHKIRSIYSIRSYQAALGFLKFYNFKQNVVFDPRTDWITENINIGVFKDNSKTVKFWKNTECEMLMSFSKTIFISDTFKDSVLERYKLERNNDKYIVVYNPIDYQSFQYIKNRRNNNFLYTGSLGHWNNLDIYLEFFLKISPFFDESKLIICTSSPARKVEPILNKREYATIKDRIEVYYSVPLRELPNYYHRCRFGLQLMSKKDSRVGVKFIEYIASGIIPIINRNVEGAVMLSKKYNLGIIIDDNYSDNDNLLNLVNSLRNTHLDINSSEYLSFKKMTDLKSITEILSPIYE